MRDDDEFKNEEEEWGEFEGAPIRIKGTLEDYIGDLAKVIIGVIIIAALMTLCS